MNVARLNFSHGNFEQHAEVIERIRNVSKAAGRRVAIMGDLPGPKMVSSAKKIGSHDFGQSLKGFVA